MSFLQLSNVTLEESMLHTGVQDESLGYLSAGSLPPKMTAEIGKLFKDLYKSDKRDSTLTQLINTVLRSFNPTTRADYLWYIQFTVTVLLLKNLPVSFYTLQGHLLTKCFSQSFIFWDSDPLKIDYFASNVYNIMENDKNLIFVTSQIESRSTFGFHLSLCLMWKSLYRCIDEEKPIFRLYPPSDLIALTQKISLKKLDTDFEIVMNFIILHSKIASLIFHRKCRTAHPKCFEEFFAYDVSLVKSLLDFLENLLTEADSMRRIHKGNLNYLMMIEYLYIDISDFERLYRSMKCSFLPGL